MCGACAVRAVGLACAGYESQSFNPHSPQGFYRLLVFLGLYRLDAPRQKSEHRGQSSWPGPRSANKTVA